MDFYTVTECGDWWNFTHVCDQQMNSTINVWHDAPSCGISNNLDISAGDHSSSANQSYYKNPHDTHDHWEHRYLTASALVK